MNNSENISTTVPNSFGTKTTIADKLRQHYAEITFTKKDGTDRIMKCTLREGEIVPYEKKTERTREPKDNLLAVWDLEAAAWRSINIDTIKNVEVYQ